MLLFQVLEAMLPEHMSGPTPGGIGSPLRLPGCLMSLFVIAAWVGALVALAVAVPSIILGALAIKVRCTVFVFLRLEI